MIVTKAYEWTESVKVYFERTLEINGSSYLVIYGEHINGGFIAIPNWNISCEAADRNSTLPTDVYNSEKLVSAGLDVNIANTIAFYIQEYITGENNTPIIDNCKETLRLMGRR